MDTKKLRQKILDLAIHGRLVPQDPNDEPAAALLQRIREEKERLVKEGKIKRNKKAKAASDANACGNELPQGWVLTNIGDLLINRDGERKPVSSAIRNKQTNKIYDYYGAAGVIDKVDSFLFDERLLLIGEDGANLLSRSKDNAFFAEGKYWVNNHAHVLDATNKRILEYVAMVINSMKLDDFITGSAQPKLSQDNLNKIPIALPPLDEQKRIINEIERWFALIDKIEQSKTDLQAAVKQAKAKILDLAIHGKLVPQDPSDEPASELLRRINPAATACDKGDYEELTKGWEKVTMSSLFLLNPKNKLEDDIEVGFVPMNNVEDGYSGKHSFEKRQWKEVKKGYCHFQNGDIGVAKISPCFENLKSVIFENLPNAHGCGTTELVILRSLGVDTKFYLYMFKSPWYISQGTKYFKGVVGQQRVNKDIFTILEVPLPPLPEQHRIVSKIEALFAQLDRIQTSLEA